MLSITFEVVAPGMLTTEQINEIKLKLLEEKDKIEKELSQIGTRDPKDPSNFNINVPEFGTSEEDNATEVATYTDNLSIEQSLEKTLSDISGALERIAAGQYGVCKYCGQDIAVKRLLARPASSSCVDCKKKLTLEQ